MRTKIIEKIARTIPAAFVRVICSFSRKNASRIVIGILRFFRITAMLAGPVLKALMYRRNAALINRPVAIATIIEFFGKLVVWFGWAIKMIVEIKTPAKE